MTGLRERKKERTSRRILDTAARLFTANTFEGTTMEDVAEAAEVSVGTVYNYFGSKPTLLLSIVVEDVEAVARRGAPIVEDPGDDLVAAVAGVIDVYLDVYLDLGRDLMREVVRASFGRTDDDLMPELLQIDQRLLEQLRTLVHHFQNVGILANDVSVEEATSLLFSIVVASLIVYISLDDVTVAEVHADARRQIALAFRGMRSSDRAQSNPGDPGGRPDDHQGAQ